MKPTANARWLTWANLLSAIRLTGSLPCAWFVLVEQWGGAAALFVLAVVTDLVDGPIARRRGEVSALGGLLDHASDAFFVACALAALAWLGLINPYLAPLVAAAFIQYVLDSSALAGRALRTSRLGRWNGIGYFILVGIPVIGNALGLGWPPVGWVHFIGWALVVSTGASILDRARELIVVRRDG